ncbi:MAG TPA: dihydrodipicolinate synthase family protein, partial [Syntrophales bacterium]|nr:dihydrodipicolinate synthase family protein [Syntrophales bacterium]
MFKGAIVAIVTPFKNGRVDEEKLRELIEFQIENGTDGIVPCGTTGESPTLSHEEHDRVIEITVDAVKKRVPVIAGTGSNSTAEALRLTEHAREVGADGALMV